MQKRAFVLITLGIMIFNTGKAINYYVSTEGNDSDGGTQEQPFGTIGKAVGLADPGDTIFVRGGIYYSNATIVINRSGLEDNYCTLMSVPGQRAILDCSGQSLSGSNRGILLQADYWHIEGLDITGAGDNGLKIDGGNRNRIVNCAFYRNRDSGVQMGNGASYNRVINCDSYYNADPPDYGDADGFAAKLDVGVENYFYGCRAWRNCDDGWDGYMRGADNASTILENCWAFENGYLEDGTNPGPQANGNGFKMGGSDDKTLRHDYTLIHCLAFKNKAKGFDQNSNMGSMILYHCTGHNNGGANYMIYKALAAGEELVIKNCAVLGPTGDIASFAIAEANSWMGSFTVTEEDFVSVDDQSAYGARKEDGSLPDITYMHLSVTSDLVDAGVDLGLPFSGSAPDIGCFESDGSTVRVPVEIQDLSMKIYPNPASETARIIPGAGFSGPIMVYINDLTGRQVRQFYFENIPGDHELTLNLSDIQQGIYVIQVHNTKKTGSVMLKIN